MTEIGPVRARYTAAAHRLADVPLDEASLGCGNPVEVADLRPGETVLDLGSGAGLDVMVSARRASPRDRRQLVGRRRAAERPYVLDGIDTFDRLDRVREC